MNFLRFYCHEVSIKSLNNKEFKFSIYFSICMVFRLLNGCYCHSWFTRGPLHVLLGSLFGPFIRLLVHCVSLEDPGVMLQWRAVYYNFLPKMFGFGLLSGNCEWHDGVYSWPTNQQYHMTKRVRVASIVLGWLVTPLHQYADCYTWTDVAGP